MKRKTTNRHQTFKVTHLHLKLSLRGNDVFFSPWDWEGSKIIKSVMAYMSDAFQNHLYIYIYIDVLNVLNH